ncbi:streptogrisin C [Kutzneria viridogrisea]|uniref:Streptogrisin C n=1 Tax=Kutzneria viridogrisea TaxID=47990 RepID=A0ABR6BTC6_9PSEU|nr:streptogrisin C [Kutzneria viridogrisea]
MKTPSRAHLLAAGGLVTALAAAAALIPAFSAASTSEHPVASPGMLAAMRRDLGLTAEQASSRLTQEDAAQAVARQVRQELGAVQAGYWFDAASGKLAVAVTDQASADRAAALGATPKLVKRGKAELDRLASSVSALTGSGITSWGVDPASNTLVVSVNSATVTQSVLGELGALGEGVRVVRQNSAPRQQSGTVTGGNPWWPGSESNCSIAFAATTSDGARHFLTAGHCTNDANQPAYGASGQQNRIGTSNVGGNHSVNAREGDFGLVDVDQSGWNLSATVNAWGSGNVTVSGSAEGVVGQSICHSGNTTHWQCGTITKVNESVDYGNGLIIDGLSETNACSNGGDSGGSYVSGDKAVGIHSGGGAVCGQANPDTIFQPVNEALSKWGLTLVTGGGNPPTTTTTTPNPPTGKVTFSNPGNQWGFRGSSVFPLQLKATASDGGALTYSATGLPPGLVISASGRISGTPSSSGTFPVTARATESTGVSGTTSFTYQVYGF